jgi:hypothetical protein
MQGSCVQKKGCHKLACMRDRFCRSWKPSVSKVFVGLDALERQHLERKTGSLIKPNDIQDLVKVNKRKSNKTNSRSGRNKAKESTDDDVSVLFDRVTQRVGVGGFEVSVLVYRRRPSSYATNVRATRKHAQVKTNKHAHVRTRQNTSVHVSTRQSTMKAAWHLVRHNSRG